MPKSQLSSTEFGQVLRWILQSHGSEPLIRLLESCHDCQAPGSMHYERFFGKAILYRDFELWIPFFEVANGSVQAVNLQLKRSSRLPAPLFNRNRRLVRELKRILDDHYGPRSAYTIHDKPDDLQGQSTQYHYRSRTQSAFVPPEEWGSECVLCDEPHSSGQTAPEFTRRRNDFVIVRFRRGGLANAD